MLTSYQELVWSGACVVKNQNTCDFRAWTSANGTQYVSAILSFYHGVDPVGRAVIFDDSLNLVQTVRTPHNMVPFNMHEFHVINEGRSALHIVQKTELADVTGLELGVAKAGLVVNMGIREVDLETGEELFIWWAQDHIGLNASYFPSYKLSGPYPDGWDWL